MAEVLCLWELEGACSLCMCLLLDKSQVWHPRQQTTALAPRQSQVLALQDAPQRYHAIVSFTT